MTTPDPNEEPRALAHSKVASHHFLSRQTVGSSRKRKGWERWGAWTRRTSWTMAPQSSASSAHGLASASHSCQTHRFLPTAGPVALLQSSPLSCRGCAFACVCIFVCVQAAHHHRPWARRCPLRFRRHRARDVWQPQRPTRCDRVRHNLLPALLATGQRHPTEPGDEERDNVEEEIAR